MVPNRGELPMYYVEKDHEPIVTKEVFAEVQGRFQHGQRDGHSTTHIFSHKLYCSDCGGLFGPIPTHTTTTNDIVWKCSNRHLRKYPCTTPSLYEEMLKPIFHEIIMDVLQKSPGITTTTPRSWRRQRRTNRTSSACFGRSARPWASRGNTYATTPPCPATGCHR